MPVATRGRSAVTVDDAMKLQIDPVQKILMLVRIKGQSQLVVHNFSEKSKKEIRDKQGKKGRQPKDKRDPQAEFEAAKYKMEDGREAIPSQAVKVAMVNACRFVGDASMTFARGAFHVYGLEDHELLPIEDAKTGKPVKGEFHEGVIRLPNGAADLRYRPLYKNWAVTVPLYFNPRVVTQDQLVNLLEAAGFHCGLCEGRPLSRRSPAGGIWGMFEVDRDNIHIGKQTNGNGQKGRRA